MNNSKKYTINSFKDELGRLFVISFGVFLFILFFQPFPLDQLDYHNRLLFVTGFGVIIFILAGIILIIIPILLPKWFKTSEWESGPPFILSIFLLALNVTAFAFYVRYVGMVKLSPYIMFKLFLVCLLPLIILGILYKNKSLERTILILREQNKYYLSKIREYEKNGGDEIIDILSENKTDKLSLKYKNIIIIKSADNYIEIYHLKNSIIEKKLLRNTLKNIDLQLAKQTNNFIRCHRTSIVNVMHINKLLKNHSGYSLNMNHLEETIPVSRQYLMHVKEAITNYQ